jgi:hypothetical protein
MCVHKSTLTIYLTVSQFVGVLLYKNIRSYWELCNLR